MPDRKAVYVVDDDDMIRRSIDLLLVGTSFSPRQFASGREFLDAAPTLPPGCVLLDIRMAGLDGLQVVQLLENHRTKLPVVMMTGHGDIETAVRAMKLGVVDVLEKPFSSDVLFELLRRIFSKLGGQLLDHEVEMEARRLIDRLTPREIEVLRGLIAGRSNKMLAFELGLSTRTVEMHRSNMMLRLGAKSISDALKTASIAGLNATR